MAAQLLDGDALAAQFREEVAKDVERLKGKGRAPYIEQNGWRGVSSHQCVAGVDGGGR